MKHAGTPRSRGIGSLELIEEATFLLRRAPVEILALYYLGTLPFMMGILYFWADMSRNADANLHLPVASLGLALLFVWMKYWQSRFCGGLSRLLLSGSATPTAIDIVVAQAAFQSFGLTILPLALLVTLPFGWCFAFFQNVTVIGGGTELRRVYDSARRQAILWQGQNHVLIGVFFILGLAVFANICMLAYFFPRILKTLFGMESIFTRSNLFLLNSTFWAAMAVLTHICVDPLIKAAYLLRCHYGESLSSGADLLAELRGVKRSAGAGIAVLALATSLLITGVCPAMAVDASAGSTSSSPVVRAQKLDRTIEQVISGPEFAWRLPRSAQQKGELPGFVRSAVELIGEWCADAWRLIIRFFKWLAGILPKITPVEERGSSGTGLRDYVFPIIYGLLALFLSLGVVSLWRQIRRKRVREPEVDPPPLVMELDILDENVMADELSEERWSVLARDLLGKGELRLGMRALYLACLAFLAQEKLIAIARYKSNRDYERELARFSHTLPQVAASFSSNMVMFEQAWYGVHLPEPGMVEAFTANYERIVSGVRKG